ncbi:cupin domain-containing protein [Rhodoplanes azumiensis]|uniref:Cupin domain-containing protein n=1 Tax=Rhodoplanes azumiensis TaxID=1897628 RepID=A0ABW5AIE1_9BRAD
MAIHFNESEVPAVPLADGVTRQRLLDKARVPGVLFELDRIVLAPGAGVTFDIAADALGWFQMIDGTATLRMPDGDAAVLPTHIGLLPPGLSGTLDSEAGATLLFALVPDVGSLDPAVLTSPPPFRLVDWREEPLLKSEHDARKRIYIVTPKMFGVRAIRGEMIIYPPGTTCPVHHHEGGAHFMYFLAGQGTCYAGEAQEMRVKTGDVVFYHDREPHWVKGGETDDMIFSEFFVPSAVATVWADPSKVCTWIPMGVNHRGGAPSRTIEKHAHGPMAEV